jgi:hypothetical protein
MSLEHRAIVRWLGKERGSYDDGRERIMKKAGDELTRSFAETMSTIKLIGAELAWISEPRESEVISPRVDRHAGAAGSR